MLDPKNVQSVLRFSTESGNNSASELQKPFMEGVENMSMSGSDASRSILKNVNQSCDQMMKEMGKMFDGLQDNLDAHQKMQQAERPKDFDTAMKDLRTTLSSGFPEEMKSMFDKMPKI